MDRRVQHIDLIDILFGTTILALPASNDALDALDALLQLDKHRMIESFAPFARPNLPRGLSTRAWPSPHRPPTNLPTAVPWSRKS